jgi:hypothetical protein
MFILTVIAVKFGGVMPQITCPNCGTTINLENRRETDFDMIKNATDGEAKTFTELLHITNLSRKTLSLRLKEMCQSGILMKSDGIYNLNGGIPSDKGRRKVSGGFARAFRDKRLRTGLMLAAFILFTCTSSYVLASFIMPRASYQEPAVLGNFSVALDVNADVKNIYAWQVAVRFDSSEMKVLQVMSGDFVGSDFPLFVNSTDTHAHYSTLLLGGTLLGNDQGKDGPGRLATIVFGYFLKDYAKPEMVLDEKTFFLDSSGSNIPYSDSTLILRIIQKD